MNLLWFHKRNSSIVFVEGLRTITKSLIEDGLCTTKDYHTFESGVWYSASETAVVVVLSVLDVENAEIWRILCDNFSEEGDTSRWWDLTSGSVGFQVSKIINSVTQKTFLFCKQKKLHVNVTL
jgi:hypothetical protein